MWKRLLSVAVLAAACGLVLQAGAGEEKKKKEVGKREDPKYFNTTYVPTADEVIEKMFEMGKVGKDDLIFDLGCGDARILFMAAKKFGARGVGLELNPERIVESMDQRGTQFGSERLQQCITKGARDPLPELVRNIGRAVELHYVGDSPPDDLTLLAVRRNE